MSLENKQVRRGQIYYVNGGPDNKPIGSEIWPDRMGLVVSADANNISSGAVEVVYLTRSFRKKVGPTHVRVISDNKKAIALCEQVHSVDKSRLGDYINSITAEEQKNIDSALILSLGLIVSNTHLLGMFKKWENYINKYHLSIIDEQKLLRQSLTGDVKTNDIIEQLIKERDCYKALYESKNKILDEIQQMAK